MTIYLIPLQIILIYCFINQFNNLYFLAILQIAFHFIVKFIESYLFHFKTLKSVITVNDFLQIINFIHLR